jgi:hypothetical protein
MIFEAEFDIRKSWQAATSRRAWLKRHEDELRRIAAHTGWANVAELLESRGWSVYWGVRPLSAEILAREYAQIAFRRRKRDPKPALSDRRIAAAVADELRESLRAELEGLLAARPAQAQPAPAEATPAPATGEITTGMRTRDLVARRRVSNAGHQPLSGKPAREIWPPAAGSRLILSPDDAVETPAAIPNVKLIKKED